MRLPPPVPHHVTCTLQQTSVQQTHAGLQATCTMTLAPSVAGLSSHAAAVPSALSAAPSAAAAARVRVWHVRPWALKLLANSLAPSIYGHETIKEGMVLMLMGGMERVVGNMHIRCVRGGACGCGGQCGCGGGRAPRSACVGSLLHAHTPAFMSHHHAETACIWRKEGLARPSSPMRAAECLPAVRPSVRLVLLVVLQG